MDTLAHGLWGGAAFGQKKGQYTWAFVWGMCPDLFSFGPFFVSRLGDLGERWAHHQFGPPDPSMIPPYVYHAYNVTHSFVVFSAAFAVIWAARRKIPWPFAAWGLHILCDIPTHSIRFFPTPYLWPFRTPFYDGVSWGHKSFMIENYLAIAFTYGAITLFHKLRRNDNSHGARQRG